MRVLLTLDLEIAWILASGMNPMIIDDEEEPPQYDAWQAANVNLGFTEPFFDDGYTLTPEMIGKYKASNETIPHRGALIRERSFRLFKNVSIFDVTGYKVTWADIAPFSVEKMLGVYYLLSEHKSFWNIPKEVVKVHKIRGSGENPFEDFSPFEEFLPKWEASYIDVNYMKRAAIARIVDGEIQTSRTLISLNY